MMQQQQLEFICFVCRVLVRVGVLSVINHRHIHIIHTSCPSHTTSWIGTAVHTHIPDGLLGSTTQHTLPASPKPHSTTAAIYRYTAKCNASSDDTTYSEYHKACMRVLVSYDSSKCVEVLELQTRTCFVHQAADGVSKKARKHSRVVPRKIVGYTEDLMTQTALLSLITSVEL